MNDPLVKEFSPYIFWTLEIIGFSILCYSIVMKKWIFRTLSSDFGDSPWQFGGTFLAIMFFMTAIIAVIALVWPPILMLAMIYAFGAFLFFIRKKLNVEVKEDLEEKFGPSPGPK